MKTSRRFIGVHSLNVLFAIGPRFVALLLAAFAPSAALWAQSNYATPYTFTTFAGNAGYGSADGTGGDAQFYGPNGVAVDGLGNVYVADFNNHTIRKITPDGVVGTFAGSAGNSGSVDGAGNIARFNNPMGVAVDDAGNVYVADHTNHTIRKVTSGGMVTTLAGMAGSSGSADGTGSAVRFDGPTSVAVDGEGNIYVADHNNNTIRKITSAGLVTTLAGTAGFPGSTDGAGSAAQFSGPSSVTIDGTGDLYVADTGNYTIRRITPAGAVTTFAGKASFHGANDGTSSAARFDAPWGLAVDNSGNVYVSDTNLQNATIRKITSAGVVTTIAGGLRGSADGTGSVARFYLPTGLAADGMGNIYVADSFYSTIRKITPAGVVTTFAGTAIGGSSSDGTGVAARFYHTADVAADNAGNLYVADYFSHTIRKITTGGVVSTIAGFAGSSGSIDGTGSAARFYYPSGVAVDGSGNVYVADGNNHTIRKITPGGVVRTLAGIAGSIGSTDGEGSTARFNFPVDVAVDNAGVVYVADDGNSTIRKITPAGIVTTFAGSALASGWVDGVGSSARFSGPAGVAVDGAGNVYVSDGGNMIRKITSAGLVTTLAGRGTADTGSADGMGSAARFSYPCGVTVDGTGSVYVADFGNQTIRKVTASGMVTTLGGTTGSLGATDGTGGIALFSYPRGVAVDNAGILYVADSGNSTIRKGVSSVPMPPALTTQPAASQTVIAGTPVTFTVTASGTPAPNYQWQKDGVNISGATNNSYAIANPAPGDSGNYTVIATNSVASVTSGGALLHVEAAYVFSTLAGVAATGSADGTAGAAQFNGPSKVAVDGSGNLYVADTSNHTIRKITSAGVVTTFAGAAGLSGSADGTGSAARFNAPAGVAVDSSGNIYVGDSGNSTIRKITSGGAVTTLAGAAGANGLIDGIGGLARFTSPSKVAIDSSGNVYVADFSYNVIRKITSVGVVTTIAGTASWSPGSIDGTGSVARFNHPSGVTVDGSGNICVADAGNGTIRKITSGGVVSTFAGTAGVSGSTDGTGSAATFLALGDISVDGDGNLYVADGYTIRKITPAGVVSTLAGTPYVTGSADGTGGAAKFGSPSGVTADGLGNVYVVDSGNNTIRKITSAGAVTTFAGTSRYGHADGTGSAAMFNKPSGVVVDVAGNVYVADNSVRKITPGGVVTTLVNDIGATAVAMDEADNIYALVTSSGSIMKITSAGVITTLAGGSWGSADGTGSAAQFFLPFGLAVDGTGNVYVADSGNNTIRKITPAGVVTTLAGLVGGSGSNDGTGGAARFNFPMGVAVDLSGNVYVADTSNDGTLRKITPAGVVTTLATQAAFGGVTVDAAGNVYATYGNSVRKTTPDGIVTILAGSVASGSTDGPGLTALFNTPSGIAIDGAGNIYVADNLNSTIRKGVLAPAAPAITAQPAAIQSVVVGGSVTFTTTASGTPAPVFQWQKDGVNISGATNNSYTIANAATGDAGTYTVTVTNAVSSVTSIGALLQVEAAYTFTTLAGKVAVGSADGTGTAAQFDHPNRAAVDGLGNIYVSDGYNNTIRKITAAGVVTTFAGTAGISGSADGTGSTARFHGPVGVAIDSSGKVYVADSGNHTIRRITSAGVVSTFAGVAGEPGSADGMGSLARFDNPRGVAVDGLGNVYVSSASTIRKISGAGLVTTLAGLADNPGSTDGVGSAARFNNPRGLTVDGDGNVYVADSYNDTVRKVTPAGVVTTLAGTVGAAGTIDGTATAASFVSPSDVSLDAAGNLYVADESAVRKITPAGVVTTFAGTPYIYGSTDGAGGMAKFSNALGVTVDGSGNLFIADTNNSTIRKITAAGEVATFAGAAGFGDTDGTGSAARFSNPDGVAVDTAGNIYVGDNNNQLIRKITPAGVVTTLAHNVGGAAVAVDNAGNVYATRNNTEILKITPLGVVTVLAGGTWGSLDGTGSEAQFAVPFGVAADEAGNVYVADSGNNAIRKVTPTGVVTTLAGLAGSIGSNDGTGSAARFNFPWGMAVDAAGFVYVADGYNMIRKITPAGVVTTLATEAAALGMAVDGAGNVYSTYGGTITKTTPAGIVTTLAGSTSGGSTNGTGLAARFRLPWGIAVDGSGNLYVADSNNNTIRKGLLAPIVADATVILGELSATYDGLPHAASATTAPASLVVNLTYNGSVTVPTNAGTYAVVATINHPGFQGSASGSLVIAKAAPVINWTAPAPIPYGTALNDTQLSATTNVAGTFVYSPANGTMMLPGEHSLTGTFTPNDTANYSSVVVHRPLTVQGDGRIPAGFEVADFYSRNPDVQAIFGADLYGAWLYYRDHGIYQGEVFDDLFRVEEYLALYPDLSALFGDDLGGALEHWLSTGRIEGRLGRIPLEFKAQGYFDRNPDVAAAVNNDALLAWGHYWAYGIYEGRAYDDELRVFEYLAINADLTAAFVNDWRQAALHWMRYGRTEGRLGRLPLTFNVTEYLNRSPDVAAVWGTNPTTVFLHFWLYGIDENRTYDDLFRPDEYLTRYPDIAAAVGGDRRGAFKHWVRYGLPEERLGRYP